MEGVSIREYEPTTNQSVFQVRSSRLAKDSGKTKIVFRCRIRVQPASPSEDQGRSGPPRSRCPVRVYQSAGARLPGGGSTGRLGRCEKEGVDRGFSQPRAGVASPWPAGGGPREGLPGQAVGQGHPRGGL